VVEVGDSLGALVGLVGSFVGLWVGGRKVGALVGDVVL
jgi:hypothetical protein